MYSLQFLGSFCQILQQAGSVRSVKLRQHPSPVLIDGLGSFCQKCGDYIVDITMAKSSITADRPTLPDSLHPVDWTAVEDAFRDWYARNYSALEVGGTGDLVGLVSALNAASAKR
jgi:hypothetical protein